MRDYTSLDLIRFHNMANESKHKNKKPIAMIKAYNKKHPELSSKQKLINLAKSVGASGLYKALTGTNLPDKHIGLLMGKKEKVPNDILSKKFIRDKKNISGIVVSSRVYFALKSNEIETVGDLIKHDPNKLLKFRGLGVNSYDEIVGIMKSLGFSIIENKWVFKNYALIPKSTENAINYSKE